jgi:hypothetical protein
MNKFIEPDIESDKKVVNFLNTYNKMNNSFKEKAIFCIGHSAGFFSEINNMILAMIYCLENNIKFCPYSLSANFSNGIGWQEFFEPFCDEFNVRIKKQFNFRTKENVNNVFSKKPLKYLAFKIQSKIFKKKHGIKYLNHELWSKFFDIRHSLHNMIFQKLGFEMDSSSELAFTKMQKMIWRFNKQTKQAIDEIISHLNLSQDYLAIHVRSGDKILEVEKLLDGRDFMKTIKQNINLIDIFVFADDYRQIEQLRRDYPDYNFYTLCKEHERGYYNNEFQALSWDMKKSKLLDLFANIEICRKSNLFIHTGQANPDIFIMRMMDHDKSIMISA